jgi:hypothetical protein
MHLMLVLCCVEELAYDPLVQFYDLVRYSRHLLHRDSPAWLSGVRICTSSGRQKSFARLAKRASASGSEESDSQCQSPDQQLFKVSWHAVQAHRLFLELILRWDRRDCDLLVVGLGDVRSIGLMEILFT